MTCCCGNGGAISVGLLKKTDLVINETTITELVENAGGNTNALFRASLAWDSWSDVDFHAYEPDGTHIFFSHKKSDNSGGVLDVDMNIGSKPRETNTRAKSRPAVENISYTDLDRMPDGVYRFESVQFGVWEGRQAKNDSPYILFEKRTADEPRMSHYVLLQYIGDHAEDGGKIPLAKVRKQGTNFEVIELGFNVKVLKIHDFPVTNVITGQGTTGTATEEAATTGENPTSGGS